jgi:hypothetical protein
MTTLGGMELASESKKDPQVKYYIASAAFCQSFVIPWDG